MLKHLRALIIKSQGFIFIYSLIQEKNIIFLNVCVCVSDYKYMCISASRVNAMANHQWEMQNSSGMDVSNWMCVIITAFIDILLVKVYMNSSKRYFLSRDTHFIRLSCENNAIFLPTKEWAILWSLLLVVSSVYRRNLYTVMCTKQIVQA